MQQSQERDLSAALERLSLTSGIGSGAGAEVMSRIAAPMVGGMITAPLLSMFLLPAAYLLMRQPKANPTKDQGDEECVLQPG